MMLFIAFAPSSGEYSCQPAGTCTAAALEACVAAGFFCACEAEKVLLDCFAEAFVAGFFFAAADLFFAEAAWDVFVCTGCFAAREIMPAFLATATAPTEAHLA
jgi:hypothetical protein